MNFLTFLHAFLPLLVKLSEVDGESVQQGLECSDDNPSLLCLTKGYSTFDLPFRRKENMVKIGFEICDVLAINDNDYSITFGLYFSVEWMEPRLNLSNELWGDEVVVDEDDLVPVNLELINSLWVPNIFIYNLKTFQTISVLSKLAGLWIDRRKRIYYSQATHITFICPMEFHSFPLDTQICKFQVGSYSYDHNRMLFSVSTLGYIQNTQSIILDYQIAISSLPQQDTKFNAGALGNFSLAGFQMSLSRHTMSYIITYYLPSGLFVVVSWISFLIPPDIVPGRMSLLITLFLVLINIFNNVNTNSPKAEGLTAIEIWMLACILFVFGALIEYALILFSKQVKKSPIIHYQEKQNKDAKLTNLKDADNHNHVTLLSQNGHSILVNPTNWSSGLDRNNHKQKPKEKKEKNRSEDQRNKVFTTWHYEYAMVDRVFLFLSPILFIIFNSIYWGYFLL